MERVTREQLVERIRADRDRFDAIVARLPRARLDEPMLPGGWSVKDVLAHISWGEREAIGVVEARALVGSELWDRSEDERNAAVVAASGTRSLDDVLEGYRSTFGEYLAAVARLSDDELNDATSFSGLAQRIPGWKPWRVLYDPDHYREHGAAIAAAADGGRAG